MLFIFIQFVSSVYHWLGWNDLTVAGGGEKLTLLNSNETALKRVFTVWRTFWDYVFYSLFHRGTVIFHMLTVKMTLKELVNSPLVRTLNLWKSWRWIYCLLILTSNAQFFTKSTIFFKQNFGSNCSAFPEWRKWLSKLQTTSYHRSTECWGKLGQNPALPCLSTYCSSTCETVMS